MAYFSQKSQPDCELQLQRPIRKPKEFKKLATFLGVADIRGNLGSPKGPVRQPRVR